ncbi:MAG: response regulator, partial [Candidatus Omnitrophica bacterium]|nr:response regulator [Candidatus Omnitrophota bacterium]
KQKILIIDDEPDMVYAVQMRLETSGYQVVTALDGNEGLEKARKENPDLIILDVMLPNLDGYKISRMLKFDEKYKNIPIIMFTARGQRDDIKLGYEVGVDVYLVKPFEWKVLLEEINKLLDKE